MCGRRRSWHSECIDRPRLHIPKEQINETLHGSDVRCCCFRGERLGDGGCGPEPDAEPAAHTGRHARAYTAGADDRSADTADHTAGNASAGSDEPEPDNAGHAAVADDHAVRAGGSRHGDGRGKSNHSEHRHPEQDRGEPDSRAGHRQHVQEQPADGAAELDKPRDRSRARHTNDDDAVVRAELPAAVPSGNQSRRDDSSAGDRGWP